ncbi:tetratricopeptide repeat protein [Sphingomonas sp. 1P06PA]|uniref:tetratricopeptide repeat protein n=1 Tax=Sphingomonas sp. 1P06PA TaxID=554121 RepID=UPI0039A4D442
MPFLILSIAIQVALIIHVVRNGRNQLWILAIALLPVAGSLAYLILEILPGLRHQRHVRTLSAAAGKAIDPERELRAARDALEVAETAANEARVGDALAALDRPGEAIRHYRAAIARSPGQDRGLSVKLARCLLDSGDAVGALALMEALPPAGTPSAADRESLVRARALHAADRREEAATLYADIATRLPGDEARCLQAALLIEMGRKADALAVLEEVERREKRLDRLARAEHRAMYDWAQTALADLRAG